MNRFEDAWTRESNLLEWQQAITEPVQLLSNWNKTDSSSFGYENQVVLNDIGLKPYRSYIHWNGAELARTHSNREQNELDWHRIEAKTGLSGTEPDTTDSNHSEQNLCLLEGYWTRIEPTWRSFEPRIEPSEGGWSQMQTDLNHNWKTLAGQK